MSDEHEHVWVFHHTYSDWYDGDEEDIYYCSVEGCKERKVVYAPR